MTLLGWRTVLRRWAAVGVPGFSHDIVSVRQVDLHFALAKSPPRADPWHSDRQVDSCETSRHRTVRRRCLAVLAAIIRAKIWQGTHWPVSVPRLRAPFCDLPPRQEAPSKENPGHMLPFRGEAHLPIKGGIVLGSLLE
jgi:hypothetical protein